MSRLQDEYMDKLNLNVLRLETENSELKKQLRDLVERVPSVYLTDNSAKFSGQTHPDAKHTFISVNDTEEQKYIYESPDGGKTLYRRKLGDYDNKEQVDKDGNPLPTQMELF